MAQVHCKNLEQARQKIDAEVDLGRPIKAPIEQLRHWLQPIGLKHVIPVLANLTKLVNYLHCQRQQAPKWFDLGFCAQRDPLANLNEGRDVLKFSH